MAQCTALSCPRLKNSDPDDTSMQVNFSNLLVTRDVIGNTWCNYCLKQCALVDWGKEHHWPEIYATGQYGRYAIAEGKSEWIATVFCSQQDAIDAYHAEVIGNETMEQTLADNAASQRNARMQERRAKWQRAREEIGQ
jgi:hypothetical protein